MEYLIHIGIIVSIWAVLGMSLNLVLGYTGLLSVTHVAFFGTGAYTTAILMTASDWGFFPAMGVGVLVSIVVSGLIGLVLSRFSGDYYALVTFGFNSIIFSIFLNWQELTRGPLGIPGIDRPEIFGFSFSDNFSFLLLAVVIVAAVYIASEFIANSSLGRVLKAIREDEKAIQVFGYRTSFYKLFIFIVGAAMASVAGSLFASYISFIDPSTFMLSGSILILSMVILGGLANTQGALLGATLLTILPEVLRFVGFPSEIAAQMRQLIYGLLLVLLMMYRPQGIMGEYKL